VDFLGQIADFDDGPGAKEAAFSARFAKVKVDPSSLGCQAAHDVLLALFR